MTAARGIVRVLWWMGSSQFNRDKPGLETLPNHEQEYDISEWDDVVQKIIDCDLNALVQPYGDDLRIWVDDKMFRQR